jgi:hypothetical protein
LTHLLQRLSATPLHPIILAAYPVLALFARNIEETSPAMMIRPLFVTISLALLLLGLSWLVLRDRHRAALLASLGLILFFSYGHVYGSLKAYVRLGEVVGRHRYLALVWATVGIAGALWIRRVRDPGRLTPSLNVLALLLLILPSLQIVSHGGQIPRANLAPERTGDQAPPPRAPPPQAPAAMPDIYYIILDAYTRDDILRMSYGLENEPFLRELEARGFCVARCSQSNYARTSLSLGSSLNMAYLEDFFPRDDTIGMSAFIRHNAVRSFLEQAGYRIVAIDSGYPSTQWPDADVYLQPSGLPALRAASLAGATPFEGLLFRTTAGAILLDSGSSLGRSLTALIENSPKVDRYHEITAVLNALEEAPDLAGPKFVFAHIRIPHDPYIFARDGRFLPDQEAHHPGYPDQVTYLNSRILPIIDGILERSAVPPVIVLQGDHGSPELRTDGRRMDILNGYHLPGDGSRRLYPTVTPVNSFRIIFDHIGT